MQGFGLGAAVGRDEDEFALADAGVTDVVRPLIPEGYTYWDYQRLKFPRNEGIRIDFILGSPALAAAVTGASIHREERKGSQPSDHVPVVVDLAFGAVEEDDDLPMIFAWSASSRPTSTARC